MNTIVARTAVNTGLPRVFVKTAQTSFSSARRKACIVSDSGRNCLLSKSRIIASPQAGQPWLLQARFRADDSDKELSSLVQPVPVKPCNNPDDINVGVELTGHLKKDDLLKVINRFYRRPEIKRLAAEHGLDNKLFHQAYVSFRRFCVESEALPVDLHIVLSDILQEAGHVDDIFPYFLRHAKEMFPHLECMDDLKKISDLRLPANWYPEARSIQRKIIYHAGPTNSGKTYHALERLLTAKSGVYCGPLRLLANEVFHKANAAGTPCDLVTGEERRAVNPDGDAASHVACTVEMTSVTTPFEVAVIDEIQMMRDAQRGWAWTRALLGVCAQEIHVCGEASAIEQVRQLMLHTGDEVEVRKYKRLTSLTVLKKAVDKFDNVKPGDCIVCFSKNDIYYVSRELEKRGRQCAVIYGTLPAGTKLAQAKKFNDPNDPCNVMIATDAIGMGLNLNIKRIVFYSLVKPTLNQKGEKEIDVIPASTALQIAGRAGRYGTHYEEGEVTSYRSSDLPMLKKLLKTPIEPLEQAGLHPTAEQIELFAYHLPKATLSNLIDIFVTLCQVDNSMYFMCNVDDFKFLADMIEHIPLSLRARYVFCCAPISKKQPFICTMFLKFARRFSKEEPLTLDWLCRQLGWPIKPPAMISDLVHLEAVFDVLDLYLWLSLKFTSTLSALWQYPLEKLQRPLNSMNKNQTLRDSYRFSDMFPDTDHVRDMQTELDAVIQQGVLNITRLLKAAETPISSGTQDDEDDFEIRNRFQRTQNMDLEDDVRSDYDEPVKKRTLSLTDQFRKAKMALAESAYDSRLHGKNGSQLPKTDEATRVHSGRLTDQLLKQGLLTQDMLDRLQRELLEDKNKGGKRKK